MTGAGAAFLQLDSPGLVSAPSSCWVLRSSLRSSMNLDRRVGKKRLESKLSNKSFEIRSLRKCFSTCLLYCMIRLWEIQEFGGSLRFCVNQQPTVCQFPVAEIERPFFVGTLVFRSFINYPDDLDRLWFLVWVLFWPLGGSTSSTKWTSEGSILGHKNTKECMRLMPLENYSKIFYTNRFEGIDSLEADEAKSLICCFFFFSLRWSLEWHTSIKTWRRRPADYKVQSSSTSPP